MIRILIADDHAMVRAGLIQLLAAHDDFMVVGAASNGVEAIEMAKSLVPDVVLMDIAMPVMDGVAATASLTALFPQMRVIILSTFHDPVTVKRVLAAGAAGYLIKNVGPEALSSDIRSVLEGGAPLSPTVAAQLIRSGRAVGEIATLTPRERQILEHIAAGNSNKQIARLLGISELTVKSHCSRLFQRIGVTDRTQAAVWATNHLRL